MPEDGVPDDLTTVEDPESNEQQDAEQEDVENQIPHHSHLILPLPHQQQAEQDAIRALINGVDARNWPAKAGDPINELRTEGFHGISNTFSVKFP